MKQELRPYKGTKQLCAPLGKTDLNAIVDLAIESCNHRHGIVIYPETEEGLTAFWERSKDYLRYLADYNSTDPEVKLYPDIESWAMFIGMTRKTLFLYEKERSAEWKDAIGYIKGCIAAAKKQLILSGRVPAVIGIFDLVNNHNYENTNRIQVSRNDEPESKQKSNAELLESLKGAIVEEAEADQDDRGMF